MNELFRTALYLPHQASSMAHEIDVLHYTVIFSAFAVAFLSFAAVVYCLIRFRDSRPRKAPRWKPSHALEVVLAGFTLTVFIVWWCIGFTQYRDMHTMPNDAIRIHVVAKQWMWQFVYPNGATAEDDLRVPVGEPVEVLLTARDVIHSFYVPAFRLKQDAVPGRVTTLWFTAVEPGTFDILCAEYCGTGHSKMRGHVIAMQPADYARWVNGHRVSADLAESGQKLAAAYGCFRCHTIDGTPHIGPTWLGLYGSQVKLSDGRTITADDAYLTESMMDPGVKIVAGYAPVMPSFLGQLSGPEADAIVEYIHSLRRNP